jgi:hypothetical protein
LPSFTDSHNRRLAIDSNSLPKPRGW